MSAADRSFTAKLVAMSVLFSTSLILGSIPVLLKRYFNWNNNSQKTNPWVQKLLCVGGGVLLCTTFIHLLPEVSEKIDEIDSIPTKEIHYAEILMCAGFFLMYFVEESVHLCLHKHHHEDEINEPQNGEISVCTDKSDKNHHSHLSSSSESTMKSIRGLFVVLALSVHELFEGLAVGLESSSVNVWYMFGAVSAHKLVIAFCIGIELVISGLKNRLVIIYIFIFAVVSPLGIGMGIIVTVNGEAATAIPSVFLQGLASGTLLYVVFFEILNSERKNGFGQFVSVLLGFLIMFVIKMFE